MVELKIAAVADAFIKQKANVQPQRLTIVQVCTAWPSSFQKIVRIIA